MFDNFIINDITYRCNIMCSITAHNKLQPTYVDDASSGGGRAHNIASVCYIISNKIVKNSSVQIRTYGCVIPWTFI